MTYTRTQLRDAIRKEIKIDPNGRIWDDSTLNGYINDSLLQVQRDGDFQWDENQTTYSLTTTSGTAEYSLPTRFSALDLVRFDGEELKSTSKKTVYMREGTIISSGSPYWYYIYGNKIGLYPTPDSTKTVDMLYRQMLEDMDSDADTLVFPDAFAPAIAKYGAYLAWSAPRGNADSAAQKYGEYQIKIRQLKGAYMVKDRGSFNLVTPRSAPVIKRDNEL